MEIPNGAVDRVSLGDILREQAAFLDKHPLMVGLGRGINGAPVVADMAQLRHLLFGGATDSEMLTCVRVFIVSVLMRATPDEVRMLLMDSGSGRFASYVGLPHLIEPINNDPWVTVEALRWAEEELDRRYDDLAGSDRRDIDAYNDDVQVGDIPAPMGALGGINRPHPYILAIVDELNEAMRVAPRAVEKSVARLTQLGRAVGIHLLLVTTSPTEQVVTDRIKAHIPTRVGSAMLSENELQRVLDHPGAAGLPGRGGVLFRGGHTGKPQRLEFARVTGKEIAAIVDHCRCQADPALNRGPEPGPE